MKVSILTNLPAAYRMPLYESVDARLKGAGGALSVIYAAETQRGRQWSDSATPETTVASVYLNRRPLRIGSRSTYANPLVAWKLEQLRPDVVVIGGFAPWAYAAAAWCRARRKPFLIWSGETIEAASARRAPAALRRPLLRGAGGFLAYGPDAADYLTALGVEQVVTVLGNGIDFGAFAALVDQARPRRSALRRELGLDGPAILCVGGKNLPLAQAAVRAMSRDATLAVAGRDREGAPGVVWLGRLPSARMPEIYAAADVLVHVPVFDQWPHAINEAIAAGLPVVAARHTGAPDDLFEPPGCRLADAEWPAVAGALDQAVDFAARATAEDRDRIRAAAAPWDIDRMVERFVEAVRAVHG